MNKQPYGSWPSPITSDLIVSQSISFQDVRLDGDDLYWLESRPQEKGRAVIVRRTPDGETTAITPAPFYVRSRVHEYGGGAFNVYDGVVYFVDMTDQQIYQQTVDPLSEPVKITAAPDQRFADLQRDPLRNRLFAICEDHSAKDVEPSNRLVVVDCATGEITTIASGNDFYSSPTVAADGRSIAWLSWHHPNMPWDGTELWIAKIDENGLVSGQRHVAGHADESIFQPQWGPDGRLYFVADRSGWWNLYRFNGDETEALCPLEAEFGLPQWGFGMSTYAFADSATLVCSYTEMGHVYLATLDLSTKQLRPVEFPYTTSSKLRAVNGQVICIAGSPTMANAIVQLDLLRSETTIIARSTTIDIDPAYLSIPETITYPTQPDGQAHAFYYPPQNGEFEAPAESAPPLLVFSHGGPTSFSDNQFRLGIQYWTSRGFAVIDVNYSGSSGYGRAYRNRLRSNWGVNDVLDCICGAQYLVEQGLADGNRLAIRGGSAGGYTTLSALTFHDVFHAGASYFGISDLAALIKDTHKFESRYMDHLLGPYPEAKEIYDARSPIHAVEQISCPMLVLQGGEDKIVLPNQAEMIVDALRARKLPVGYLLFPEESHGFRQAENIKQAQDAELYFYSRVFGFDRPELDVPVTIENLS